MEKDNKQTNNANQEGNTQEEKTNNPFFTGDSTGLSEFSSKQDSKSAVEEGKKQNGQLVKQLEQEKQQLSEEFESLKSQYVRLAADFDNFRKRQDQVKQDLYRAGAIDVIEYLLPVLDTFDKAYSSFQTMDDPEKLKESFNVVYRQMQDGLSRMQVCRIKTAGELFDPNYHQAVMREETEEYEDNAIVAELQPGYIAADKVIRPAMVKVASNPGGTE